MLLGLRLVGQGCRWFGDQGPAGAEGLLLLLVPAQALSVHQVGRIGLELALADLVRLKLLVVRVALVVVLRLMMVVVVVVVVVVLVLLLLVGVAGVEVVAVVVAVVVVVPGGRHESGHLRSGRGVAAVELGSAIELGSVQLALLWSCLRLLLVRELARLQLERVDGGVLLVEIMLLLVVVIVVVVVELVVVVVLVSG